MAKRDLNESTIVLKGSAPTDFRWGRPKSGAGWARFHLDPLSKCTNMNVRATPIASIDPFLCPAQRVRAAAKSGKFMNSLSPFPPVLPHLPFSCYVEKRFMHLCPNCPLNFNSTGGTAAVQRLGGNVQECLNIEVATQRPPSSMDSGK